VRRPIDAGVAVHCGLRYEQAAFVWLHALPEVLHVGEVGQADFKRGSMRVMAAVLGRE
jgi:hypothetical protein